MMPKNNPNKNRTRNYLLWIALFLAVVFVLTTVVYWWRYGTISWPTIGLMLAGVCILIVLAVFTEFRQKLMSIGKQLMSIIGEQRPVRRLSYTLFIVLNIFVVPFVLYILGSGVQKSMPPTLQWSIIAVAPTLGGLVLAGAGNRRIKRRAYNELVSVAQKLIVATVLFLLFTCFFFTVELIGGINVNSIDLSPMGWIRGGFFWISALFFYSGVYLFLLAIIDLVLALRHLRV